ncbi:MAG: inositol monophosphatase family protein [Elusimicrobiota bacterium]
MNQDILIHLEAIFGDVRRAVVTSDSPRRDIGERYNPKGDRMKWFDLAADEAVRAYLRDRFPCPVRLLSEEGEPTDIGSGKPEFTMVVDPVDGSENFARGIVPVAMAAALIPAGEPVSVGNVRFALLGDLLSGTVWIAERGHGAWCDEKPVRSRRSAALREAVVALDLSRRRVDPRLDPLIEEAAGVRAFGCAARSLAMVATGEVDAHVDLREDVTPENFLAPALLITESGGRITDPEGRPLPDIKDLTERFSMVAASSPGLHAEILEAIKPR